MTSSQQPRHVSEYARACLEALASAGLASRISLGGAFGLAHYLEYRTTNDVDAWWIEPVTSAERQQIIGTLEAALTKFGDVHTRAWGDVVSVELTREGRMVFGFQIASRSAQLRELLPAPWPGGLQLDSLDDLIASKMVALVERGAPRDFLDVHTLCEHGYTTVEQCWTLWAARQAKAGQVADRERAALAVRTHLARIEQVRPLNAITDDRQRAEAQRVRLWFTQEFLRDLPD
jgi:hypothetical protein